MAAPRSCIIAVDGSEDSDFALRWYSENVYKDGDQAVLIYVPEGHGLLRASKWENAVYSLNRDVMMEVSAEEEKLIKRDLGKFARRLIHLGLEGKVRNVMAHRPEEGILRAAEEENAHLIVVGSRGRGTLRRTFVGSVSDYLVHHAPCPVVALIKEIAGDMALIKETAEGMALLDTTIGTLVMKRLSAEVKIKDQEDWPGVKSTERDLLKVLASCLRRY